MQDLFCTFFFLTRLPIPEYGALYASQIIRNKTMRLIVLDGYEHQRIFIFWKF